MYVWLHFGILVMNERTAADTGNQLQDTGRLLGCLALHPGLQSYLSNNCMLVLLV